MLLSASLLSTTTVTQIASLLALIVIVRGLSGVLQKRFREELTAVEDIQFLGQPSKDGRKIPGAAVICGGSIAGLLSARVCSDHFEEVVIVEPEAWLATEEGLRDLHRDASSPGSSTSKRSRVAQYASIHMYQAFTNVALRRLFPDFDKEIERVCGRFSPSAIGVHLAGTPFVGPYQEKTDGSATLLHLTRPGFETVLRKLVLTHCSNVKYLTGSVTGLVMGEDGDVVTSVAVRKYTAGDDTIAEIPATLVVDCTGAAQGGLRWLQDAQHKLKTAPSVKTKSLPLDQLRVSYDPKVAYTTCEFSVPPELHEKLKAALLPFDYDENASMYINLSKPDVESNVFGMQRREANYLQMLCGGQGYRGRITSVADIKAFMATLQLSRPFPPFGHALLQFLEEHDVPATYFHPRISPRQYVRYSLAENLPSNFVAIGDSILQLNPMRGQGCTTACIGAVTLNGFLARIQPIPSDGSRNPVRLPSNFGKRFFSTQAKRTGSQWEAVKNEDYGWKCTIPQSGDDPNSTFRKLQRWYSGQILELATVDPAAAYSLWHVEHFLAPSTDLFMPRMIAKVLWLGVSQLLRGGSSL